jgi:ferredoxin-type protein NapF
LFGRRPAAAQGTSAARPAGADGGTGAGADAGTDADARAVPEGAAPAAGPAVPRQVARPQPGCLALRGIDCRLCADSCEPRVLRFRPRQGGMPLPVVIEADCSGCGDCLAVCPTAALLLVPVTAKATAAAAGRA